MKAHQRKDGHGNISSYMLIIGAAEARKVGFVTPDGERRELEKIVDEEAGTITFRVATEQPDKE